MWQETQHGLYKQFNFENFKAAWAFMEKVAQLAEETQHHPRWENEWNVVQIWLITHEGGHKITDKDHQMAEAIDGLISQSGNVKLELHPDKVKLFSDGGSRGNPGPSAAAYVILDKEDNVLAEKGLYLGVTSNNQAEYAGLKAGLEAVHKLGAHKVQVYMDSLLVVNQMKGIFKVKNRDLWPLHDAIKELISQFEEIEFEHVPREFNKLADRVVNKVLDQNLGSSPSQTEVI